MIVNKTHLVMGKSKSERLFGHLMGVVHQDLCLNCGACAASCPWGSIKLINGRATLSGNCTACGLCYAQCPQTVTDETLIKKIFGSSFSTPLGTYKEAYSGCARNPEIRNEGQDGGIVTGLLEFLLKEELIEGAIVMDRDSEWKTQPQVAVTRREIIDSSGAKYTPGPILTATRDAVDHYLLEKMAFVGLPCQVRAIRVMESEEPVLRRITNRVELVLGLFCQHCFSYEGLFEEKLKKEMNVNPSDVVGINLAKNGSLTVKTDDSEHELSPNSIDNCIFEPCRICRDFSARFADISIGAAGTPQKYSTILIRTDKGKEIFRRAVDRGIVEAEPLEDTDPSIKDVKNQSLKKKKSAEKEIQSRREEGKSLPPKISGEL
ncbi:hypothetical protein AKJ61_02055 [candidate division MSBL1 archaeon SCGC-AAA259B11]|uniref:4Fe-4S ferredoxin-type domain-containing protein n=1 Tax=candidate division MSBL1 archaeon SCGC-AAA259B11 TaxID=1698260 RepID=A0A133U6K9_9EURY|nr:hypothetical protein AKJ61_02055 [candidate division MSBL1 archaeon SCGC-AAA259B11]